MRMPSKSSSLPAPTGGWDTREAIADMPIDHAPIMDNWFPGTDKVIVRRGSAEHASDMSGAVETLLNYTALSGTEKLFAANGGNIYDVTSTGAVGAAAVAGLTNDRWQQVQIGTAGGQFLFGVNGADTPITYNGTSWSTASITGPTAANLAWCNLHQRRLWFGEENSLVAWYLAVNSIGGAAAQFSLAGVAKLGGYIMAQGTWTRDAGDGQDDVAVFITSEGEAIVYSGTDPSSAATWALIGVFRIGKPIGRRCMVKAGADLLIITEDGFVFCSQILALNRSQADRVALSAQINEAVNTAVRNFGSLFGWEPIIYPRGTMLIVNVPQSSTQAHQYVFNTLTGAPTRFTGVNARCWGLLNDEAYFGTSDGRVMKFDTGVGDDGTETQADCLQAFSYFKSPGRNKAFKGVEPIFESTGSPNAALDLNLDFKIESPSGLAVASPVAGATWGTARWGVDKWGGQGTIYRGWRGIRGIGTSAALRVRVSTKTSRPAWISTNFRYIPGGII
jgi:hypothetical protein